MTWRVFVPDADRLTELGYPAIAGCCSLFHDAKGYGHEPNRYLRDRYRGRWVPEYKEGSTGAKREGKRPTTSKGEADRLAHFLNWAEAGGIDVDRINYEDVLSYQDNMIAFRPSQQRPTVGAATRNQRADVATFYLMWRADQGLRPSFNVPTKLVRVPYRGTFVYSRTGRLRQSAAQLPTLSLPTTAQKLAWYSAVRSRLGEAKMLASRCIVEIGVRAFEQAALRVEQWPSRSAILDAQRTGRRDVPMKLYGGKATRSESSPFPSTSHSWSGSG